MRYSSQLLDELMNRQGRTNVWLAEQLGIEASYVGKLRSGERRMTDELASRIGQVFEIPVSMLIADRSESRVA